MAPLLSGSSHEITIEPADGSMEVVGAAGCPGVVAAIIVVTGE